MFACILVLLLTLLAARSAYRRLKYDLHKIPSPPGMPLLAHSLEFVLGQPGTQFAQWTNRAFKRIGNPKLMRVDVLGQSLLFVTDLQFIKSVMFSRTDSFPKQQGNQLLMTMLGSDEDMKLMVPAALPTPYVKAVRKIYSNALQSTRLKNDMLKIEVVLGKLVEIIEEKRKRGPIDVQELYGRLTLDIIGEVAFESKLGGLDGSGRFYELVMDAGAIARRRFTNPFLKTYCSLFPGSKEARHQKATVDALHMEWQRIMADISERKSPKEDSVPIWYGLRTLIDPETGEPIEKKQLMCEIGTVATAGMDITAQQLAWVFALLAAHPRVQEKLNVELADHGLCDEGLRSVTFEELADLPYVAAVIKEGMRMTHVTIASFPRVVPRDMTILGYRVPEDTIIFCPCDMGFSTEADWGDPDAFRPERWLVEEDMSEKYNMPFLVGPRDCPGQRLALLEMKVILIELARRYTCTLEGTFDELKRASKDGIVIEVEGGIWLNFEPRI